MIDYITIGWHKDFNGRGEAKLDLTFADQDDPRVVAILEMWRERERAKAIAQAGQGDGGNPFPAG